MKYVRTFESFRNNKNSKVEPVNEEILGFLKNLFGGMFKKAKELINKTKGGKEIEEIYGKYIKMINDEFSKQAQVDLNITAAGDESKPEADKTKVDKATEGESKEESEVKEPAVAESKVFEAEEGVDAKLDPAKLKEKKDVLDQILKKMKEMALKEMDTVLKKYGGSATNPQLSLIISAKKDQFELDVLNAQIDFLNKAGDTTMVPEITKQRDEVAKKVKQSLEKAENAKPVEYKEGDQVYFLKKDKTKEEWDNLPKEEREKPEEGKAAEIVELLTLSKFEDGKFYVKDDDGNEIEKPSDSLIKKKKVEKEEGEEESDKEEGKEEVEYKEGDKVKYKRKDGSENQAEFVKIDGDDVTLKTEKNPNGFAIKKDSLLGKAEEDKGEEKTEGEEK